MSATPPNPQVVAEPWKEEGPVLLLAGPGTGKTHQLALRVKYLVESKEISPQSIAVITFTREAAENMRRRISSEESKDVYIAPEKRPARITTMHSLGLEIIRGHAVELGLPEDFTVMTDAGLREILFRDAAYLCGLTEEDGKRANGLRQRTMCPASGSVEERITGQYEVILRASGAIDFDDQILLATKVLSENAAASSEYGAAASHLLIDEYQDINHGQQQLISFLCKDRLSGLFVVGDDDQSIYGFRGGTPKYIREFHLEYGQNAKILCLDRSRRCPDKVLHSALNVVESFDRSRTRKPPTTFGADKQNGEPVFVHDVASDDEEARIISDIVKRSVPKHSVLILTPTRHYAEKIKRALRQKRLHCSHTPPVDDTGLALLQVIDAWVGDTSDNFALRLCIEFVCESGEVSIPSKLSRKEEMKARRAGAMSSIASLWAGVIENRRTLWESLESEKENESLFAEISKKLSSLREVDRDNVSEFLSRAARDLGLWSHRGDLMKEIGSWIDELRSHGQGADGQVKILTFQAAKGLEADVVCAVGFDEGILPRNGAAPADLEETARLVYVSMTRSKKDLHLFHARTRDAGVTYLKTSFALAPSRFLGSIKNEYKQQCYHQAPSKIKKARTKGRSA
jgi:superfamily I DNA/RNA helicase